VGSTRALRRAAHQLRPRPATHLFLGTDRCKPMGRLEIACEMAQCRAPMSGRGACIFETRLVGDHERDVLVRQRASCVRADPHQFVRCERRRNTGALDQYAGPTLAPTQCGSEIGKCQEVVENGRARA
jgi:hypothetical protein